MGRGGTASGLGGLYPRQLYGLVNRFPQQLQYNFGVCTSFGRFP